MTVICVSVQSKQIGCGAAGGVVQRGVDGCLGWRGAMDARRDVFSEDLFKMLKTSIKRILRFYVFEYHSKII